MYVKYNYIIKSNHFNYINNIVDSQTYTWLIYYNVRVWQGIYLV